MVEGTSSWKCRNHRPNAEEYPLLAPPLSLIFSTVQFRWQMGVLNVDLLEI